MKRLFLALITITLIVSCAKTDTPPDSPVIPAKWYYHEHGLDEADKGYFAPEDITNFDLQYITLTFKNDGTGLYEGDVSQPVKFTWRENGTELTIDWEKPVPDIPANTFKVDSLTTHTMYLTNTFHGHAAFYSFRR